MRPQKPFINQRTSERQEGFVNVGAPLVAHPQATELMQPAQRAFDHPTILAETTTMQRVALGQHRLNSEAAQHLAMRFRVIAAIPLDPVRSVTGTTDLAADGWNRLDQGDKLGNVVRIRPRHNRGERDAPPIRDEMMLVARFGFVRGIRACFFLFWLKTSSASIQTSLIHSRCELAIMVQAIQHWERDDLGFPLRLWS